MARRIAPSGFPLTQFRATLPLAPGINAAYKSGFTKDGKSKLYMAASSVAWKKLAGDRLLEQGWRALPKGTYRLNLSYTIYCIASRDEDSVQKTLQDVLCKRINVPDSKVMECHIRKVVVPKAEQRIEVILIAERLT